MLTVARLREEMRYHFIISTQRGVLVVELGKKAVEFFEGRRQAGEIERGSANQRGGISARREVQSFLLQPHREKCVDGIQLGTANREQRTGNFRTNDLFIAPVLPPLRALLDPLFE